MTIIVSQHPHDDTLGIVAMRLKRSEMQALQWAAQIECESASEELKPMLELGNLISQAISDARIFSVQTFGSYGDVLEVIEGE